MKFALCVCGRATRDCKGRCQVDLGPRMMGINIKCRVDQYLQAKKKARKAHRSLSNFLLHSAGLEA